MFLQVFYHPTSYRPLVLDSGLVLCELFLVADGCTVAAFGLVMTAATATAPPAADLVVTAFVAHREAATAFRGRVVVSGVQGRSELLPGVRSHCNGDLGPRGGCDGSALPPLPPPTTDLVVMTSGARREAATAFGGRGGIATWSQMVRDKASC